MWNNRLKPLIPGLVLVFGLASVASWLGAMFPLVGGAVFGIVAGIAVRTCVIPDVRFGDGIRFASKQILQGSIIALGFCLPIAEVARTGMDSLSVTLLTMTAACISAVCFGRMLRVPGKLCVLIGTGTAICGGSAIAAITPVVKPDAHEAAFSLSTIFLFNLMAVFLFPPLGHLLGLSDSGFGLWAGTAINDTSSVVAAAYSWSKAAGDHATIVKLTRALMIIPVTLAISIWFGVRESAGGRPSLQTIQRTVPWFIVWFVVASAVSQFVPEAVCAAAHWLAPFMITVALTAIGLTTDIARMRQTGWRPIALGLLVWFCVAGTSLLVQSLTSRW